MPPDTPHPSRAMGTWSRSYKSHRTRDIRQQIASRLLLLFLFLWLGMPVAPPPRGALELLWAEASDLRSLKSYTAAVEVYEQIAALSPQDPAPLMAIGRIYLTQHRWPLAEDAYNRALARNGWPPSPQTVYSQSPPPSTTQGEPIRAQALAGLATARWEQGDRLRAIALWERALATWPNGAGQNQRKPSLSDTRMRLALAYVDMARPADAEAMLRQELAATEVPAARLHLAMTRAPEDLREARRELEAITDDAPPRIVAARDYLLEALKEAEGASSAGEATKLLGLAFVQIEEWQLARAALERALRLDPTDAETMAFLGHTEAQLGSPAFTHLAAAVADRPHWPLGHYLLGLYYSKQGAYEFAVEEFRVTLQLDPGNAQAQVDLARAYVSLGQYPEAEAALMGAVQSAPDDLTFHSALVGFYADHVFRVSDRGLAAARAAADLAPDDPQMRGMLGWMYFLVGDSPKARLHLESALHLDPELASTHYHLGVLRNALGEEEAARFAFQRAIDLDTDGYYRGQAQAAMRHMDQAKE